VRLYEGSEARIAQERRRLGLPASFGADETDHGAMDPVARDFKARHGPPCAVDFLGLWDTVKAYGWLRPTSFPALRHNPSVRMVRHAPALDERRALFKMTGWGDRHPQVKEVWFAGDHSDVGGGHKDGNSPLADASLRWMLGEATQEGLQLNPDKTRDVGQIAERGAEAPRATAKDLWLRSGFVALDCAPRVELDNAVYPPRRRMRVLRSDGARRPGDHVFGGNVFVHHTVGARLRAGDERYMRERLVRCSDASDRENHIAVQVADDLEIRWNTSI
jgi:T6SS, Phospholipase effector Tle1-like, catalytic domain